MAVDIKEICYISHKCPGNSCGQVCIKSGTAVGVANVIMCDKFPGDQIKVG